MTDYTLEWIVKDKSSWYKTLDWQNLTDFYQRSLNNYIDIVIDKSYQNPDYGKA